MRIAEAMPAVGQGALQAVPNFDDVKQKFALLRRLGKGSGWSLSIGANQREGPPHQWREILDLIEQASDEGRPIKAQPCERAVGILFGLELTHNPFSLDTKETLITASLSYGHVECRHAM